MSRDIRRSLTLLQAPTASVISIADFKYQTRIDFDDADADDWMNGCLAAVHNHVDGANGVLGRALLTQKWRLSLETFYDLTASFPGEVEIPLPPLQSIDSFTYLDPDGNMQTVDPSIYRVVDGGGMPSRVLLKVGQVWPATLYGPDAVRIEFTCGYDSIEDLNERHASIGQAMLLFAAHLFQNREAVTDGRINQPFEVPFGVATLLSPHRVSFF